MGNPITSERSKAGSFRNPPICEALGLVLSLGLAADTVVVDVIGGLALRIRTRSGGVYTALAHELQQAGFTYAHNHRYMIFVRCAY